MSVLYPKALAASARPVLGRIPGLGRRGPVELPDLELALPEVEIDREHLLAYDRVCGFPLRDELPATYLHVLAFPLSMEIMTDSRFPFPVIGLVHIGNRIERIQPVGVAERPTIRVLTDNLASHDRGTQFELVAEATVGGEPVWRSRSTYLRRERGGDRKPRGGRAEEPREPGAVWRLGGDVGRRYAAVSGDSNPIHIHPLTARLFGLPRPIAHGMWLKARCLAALEGSLPGSYAVEVRFKLPVQLPSRVAFAAWREGRGRGFALTDASRGRPHLAGEVEPA
jgi:acyl dehydratase